MGTRWPSVALGTPATAALVTVLAALTACSGAATSSGTTVLSAPPGSTPGTSASPSPSASQAPLPVPPGRIVFMRPGSEGVEHYFTVNTDGTDETAIYDAESCSCARLSADGTQVLSIGATGHGTWSLMTVNLNGSDKVVIDPPIETLNLFIGATSADGRVIAFQGMDETNPANNGLWLASPDLADARLVTPQLDGWLNVAPLGVTPDGSKVMVFVETGSSGGATHAGDLYVVNADGSGLRQLNPPGSKLEDVGMPVGDLSPDGRTAAFGVDDAVWVVDLEGSEAQAITPRFGYAWAASWSPAGDWLTYARFHGPTSVISLVRPDGTDDHEISGRDETDEAYAPRWSPDGRYLLVLRDSDATIDGPMDLWIMDLDGTWIGQVTHEPSRYGSYWWAPASGS